MGKSGAVRHRPTCTIPNIIDERTVYDHTLNPVVLRRRFLFEEGSADVSEGSCLAIGAMTDDNGIATLQTALGQYVESGVPEGTWKITVIKMNKPEETKTEEQLAAMSEKKRDDYRYRQLVKSKKMPSVVPYILGSPSTTPLQVNVVAPQTEMTVEVTQYKDASAIIKKATATALVE